MVLAVVVVLLVAATAAGLFLYTGSPPTSSRSSTGTGATSQSNSGGGSAPFKVIYDNLTVGFKSGLWQLSFQDVSGKQVTLMTAILHTPTESKMCSGVFGGFVFSNCPSTPPTAGSFPANATFTGYTSGAGPGSATSGTSYTVTLSAVFLDGTTQNQTLTVTAKTSG